MMSGGWERLASHEGGTVVALATATGGDGGALLFAATAIGLFVSMDGGRAWSPGGDPPLPLLTVIAPSSRFAENQVLFAGTQTGCYRSTDAGRTWQQMLSGGRIFAMAVVPGAEGTESVFVGTQQDGILRSDDGGRRWMGANPGLLDLTVLALAFSPDAARDLTGFAATTSGLYRTRNGGKSWRSVALPLDEPAVQSLAISPAFARDRLVFAGTESDGLWRSDDGGVNWDPVPDLPDGGIGAIGFSPHDRGPRSVAVATDGGVALSRDGGATWHLTGEALPPVLDLAFAPDDAEETLIAALYRDGLARFAIADPEGQWMPANAGLRATFLTSLVVSPTFARDRTLFVAGPEAGLRVSRDGGHNWSDAGPGLDDAVVYGIAISPNIEGNSGHLVFAATDAGVSRSRDHGASWETPAPEAAAPAGMIVTGMTADDGFVSVFAATLDGHVIASDDGGERWRSLGTPFDGAMIVSLACSPDGAHGRTLYVGTIRPARAVGTDAMTLWRSTDGGGSWAHWLDEHGAGGILPLAVSASEHGDDTLFVGLTGQVLQPHRNGWQIRGGVRTPLWSGAALITERGDAATITAVVVSPHQRTAGTVFAATDAGVFRSHDRGRTFDRWSEGITPKRLLALATTPAAKDTTADDAFMVFALGVDGSIWQRAGNE